MSLADIKKGETVVLIGFTGIRLAEVQVSAADKKSITITKKDGKELVFDRKTGAQTNVVEGKEKYANSISTVEDAPAPKAKKPAAKAEKPAAAKKAPAKKPAKVEEPEEDEEEEEEEPAPKKKAAKKPAKKAKVEEDEDDDYEEM